MGENKKKFIRRAALLAALVLALNGCRADTEQKIDNANTTTGEITTAGAQTELTELPEWTYASNQYITDEGVRFRLIGDEMQFEIETVSGADTWYTYTVPVADMSDGKGVWLDYAEEIERFVHEYLYFGQLDDDGQKLWFAFNEPQEIPNYGFRMTHFLYLSEDGGQTWTSAVSPTLTGNNMGFRQPLVAVDMNASGTVCMVMEVSHVDMEYTEAWVSRDFGNTWTEIPFDLDYREKCQNITTCRVLDDGTIQIDGVNTPHIDGSVVMEYTYEKAPDADAFVLITELPPLETAAGK